MYIEQLKEMFTEMVVKKNPSLIPHYYHQDFLLYTNEKEMDYQVFLESHHHLYETLIHYSVEYDEATLIEQGEKIAGRIWITVSRPNEPSRKIEVTLIAQFKDHTIYRLWEPPHPVWSKLPAFESLNSSTTG